MICYIAKQHKSKIWKPRWDSSHYVQQRSTVRCWPGNSELFPVWRHSFRNVARSWHLAWNSFNREIKFDVTWSYVKRQTAKMTSEFVFFSSNPSLNHIKIEKCLLIFATNTNIFTLLFKELKTDGKSFIFAVCGLPYDHVTSNLISLLLDVMWPWTSQWMGAL